MEDGQSVLSQWRTSQHEDSPSEDLVWLLLEDEVKEEAKKEEEEKNVSLVDCVREDDLSLLSRLVKQSQTKSDKEVAALVAAREGFLEALRILLGTF